jgi:long-chain acyl-CoA synthetase
MLLHEYLTASARRFPDKLALQCGSIRYTYEQLETAASSLAAFLHENALEKGDRVIILLDNCPEAVISIFGVLKAGGCIVVINPTTPAERLGYLLENSGAKFLITSHNKLDAVRTAEVHCTHPPKRIVTGADAPVEGDFAFSSIIHTGRISPLVNIISIDLAAIIYTSGSTGKPKGVTLTHLNIDTVTDAVQEYLENNSEDVILCVLQLSFGYGLLQLLVTFRTGGRLVLEKGYGYPYEIIKRIKEEKVTGFAGAPTLYSMLLQLSDLEKEDFSSLRYITNAAAAMPQSYIPRLRKVFPHAKIYLMHGLTEVLRTTYLPPDEIDTRPTAVGRGMSNVELYIEDPDGKRLGPGEVGELCVRGANVMQGYWNDPEATSKVLLPGHYPWERVMHSGDLFTMDKDGYFHFVARMDDVIKSRGEKVSPLEVENVLYSLDPVFECRVFGVPDPILGQAIRAEIVLKEGQLLTDRQVKAYCKDHLEDFKIPTIVAFVPSVPKTAGGKIKRTGPSATST